MIFSMECKRYSLDGLSGAHGVNEELQWGKVTILDELDGGMVLKAPIGGVEKNTGVGLVAGIEVNERNPDSIETAKLPLQAAGVGRLTDARCLPANGLRNDRNRDIEFTRDPGRVQATRLGIEQSWFHCRYCMGSRHETPLLSRLRDRRSCVNVALPYHHRPLRVSQVVAF